MLRIIVSKSAERAKEYYASSLAQADYYVEQQKVRNEWLGLGAERMGLSGVVESEQFAALADNRHPTTGEKLTPRDGKHRRVGFDLNFHCPKSVSVAYALTEDAAILDAFQNAVDQTMWEAQHLAHTLVRLGGSKSKRLTANLVWGRFTHLTARPVDGIPDPHLHAHCYVFNTTWDDVEGRWKAVEMGVIHRCAPDFERNFHEQLVMNLQAVGYPAILGEQYSELALFSQPTLDKMSRRTRQIEAVAAARGIDDAKAKGELGRLTREAKDTSLNWDELRSIWSAWVPEAERDAAFDAMAKSREHVRELQERSVDAPTRSRDVRVGVATEAKALPPHVKDEAAAIEWAISKSLARKRVVSATRVVTEAYFESGKRLKWEKLWQAFKLRKDLLRVLGTEGDVVATTMDKVVGEKVVLDFVTATRENQQSIGYEVKPLTSGALRPDERHALSHVVTDSCGIAVLTGSGSVGNRELLAELATQCTQQHMNMTVVCPSRSAADSLAGRSPKRRSRLKGIRDLAAVVQGVKDAFQATLSPGLERTQSVAEFLRSGHAVASEPWRNRGHVVVVDDAAAVSVSTFASIIEQCRKMNAKLVVTGERQGEVFGGAGNVIELLTSHGGLKEACIERRQGRVSATLESELEKWKNTKSLDALYKAGHVVRADLNAGRQCIGEAFSEAEAKNRKTSPKRRKSVVVVAESPAERDELTTEIRKTLHEKKLLGRKKKTLVVMEPLHWSEAEKAEAQRYRPGLSVRFMRSVKGFRAGELVQVLGQSRLGGVMVTSKAATLPRHLPLKQSNAFTVMEQGALPVRTGELIQLVAGGLTKDGKHRLEPGELHRVKSFTRGGDLKLEKGWVLPKDFGFVKYGYVTSPAAARGRKADLVLASGYTNWASRENFTSTMESGRNVVFYTPSVVGLERKVRKEYVAGLGSDVMRSVANEQVNERARTKERDDGLERNAAI